MASCDVVVREVVPGVITTFSKPFKRYGLIPIGGRSTAIKLQNGSLWILASTPLTPLTKSTLDKLGSGSGSGLVSYIAIVDNEHCMYTKEYVKAYPSARIVGPEGVTEKCKFDEKEQAAKVWEFSSETRSQQEKEEEVKRVMGVSSPNSNQEQEQEQEQQKATFSILDEFEIEYFSGFANKDIAFFHKPTKSLIVGDLLFNLPCTECFPSNNHHTSSSSSSSSPPPSSSSSGWSFFGSGIGSGSYLSHLSPGSTMHKWFVYKSLAVDKIAMAKSASRVKSWDFERIIPCHGDVIEKDAKKAWVDTYQNYFDDIQAGKLPAHDEL